METYKIEIAVDHTDSDKFCNWLNDTGHDASIGTTTGNYVNGVWTSTDMVAGDIINKLWEQYCIECAYSTD